MLTAKQFAKRANVSYPTVIAWLAADLIPGADKQETPLGTFWQIPASSVDKVAKRKPGPAANKATGEGEKVKVAKKTSKKPRAKTGIDQ